MMCIWPQPVTLSPTPVLLNSSTLWSLPFLFVECIICTGVDFLHCLNRKTLDEDKKTNSVKSVCVFLEMGSGDMTFAWNKPSLLTPVWEEHRRQSVRSDLFGIKLWTANTHCLMRIYPALVYDCIRTHTCDTARCISQNVCHRQKGRMSTRRRSLHHSHRQTY